MTDLESKFQRWYILSARGTLPMLRLSSCLLLPVLHGRHIEMLLDILAEERRVCKAQTVAYLLDA